MDAEILRKIVKELLNNIPAQDVERIEVNKINNRTVIFVQLINEEGEQRLGRSIPVFKE